MGVTAAELLLGFSPCLNFTHLTSHSLPKNLKAKETRGTFAKMVVEELEEATRKDP